MTLVPRFRIVERATPDVVFLTASTLQWAIFKVGGFPALDLVIVDLGE